MLPSNIHAIDFETTGVDPKTCIPIEIAVYNHYKDYVSFIYTDQPIPVETSAVHHITAKDIEVGPICSWTDVQVFLRDMNRSNDLILVAHNADYERGVLKEPASEFKWICTYKCALRIWPDMPSHKNEVLRYALGLPELGRGYAQHAHTASHDARVTYQILEVMVSLGYSVEQLIEWSKLPAKLPRIPIGKYYGQTWDTIPASYLTWICQQADMRDDVKYCAQEELNKRRR